METTVKRLCQHEGNWGPWYHVSRYEWSGRAWKLISRGGHYSAHRAALTGLKYGRPTQSPSTGMAILTINEMPADLSL